MSSSIRLYERLDQIPQDPQDPESLDDLIVCAFGAFERYYVCWKNRAGEYRQDGYDLPPALQEWLWPSDNTTRDFASLQVVFGRGDEYFASDKNGKLEFKEPEKKAPEVSEEKPGLRRSRTMSSFRAQPDLNTMKPLPPVTDSPSSPSRPASTASHSASRPPSMSFSARTLSDASFISRPSSRSPSISSMFSTADTLPTIPSRPTSDADPKPIEPKYIQASEEMRMDPPINTATRLKRLSRPLSMSFKPSSYPRISEGVQLPLEPTPSVSTPQPLPTQNQTVAPASCTCGYHADPQQPVSRPPPTYADASVQTTPPVSPIRTARPVITSYSQYASSAQDTEDLGEEVYDAPAANPFPMGSMMAFFSKPGYQLGDSLRRGYEDEYDDQYEYEDGYEQEYVETYDNDWAAWEAANGRM